MNSWTKADTVRVVTSEICCIARGNTYKLFVIPVINSSVEATVSITTNKLIPFHEKLKVNREEIYYEKKAYCAVPRCGYVYDT